MKINRGWAEHAFFTLTEHGAVRLLDALVTLVLIRVMAPADFGLFSVYQSWVAVLLLFFPSIDLALYREYGAIKREGRLTDELSVYRFFNYVKLAALVVVVACLAWIPPASGQGSADYRIRAALLAFAFALPFSQSFYSFFREPLRFEMRQHIVALLSIAQRAALVAALVLAAWLRPHDVPVLVASALVVYMMAGLLWRLAARSYLAGAPLIPRRAWKKIGATLGTIVVWIHVNGVITASIQTLDILALNHFGTSLAEIGYYGIALKAANFFQIIPIALVNSFGVFLARHRGEQDVHDEIRLTLNFLLGFAVLSLALLGLGVLVGKPLLGFLSKSLTAEDLDRTFQYFRWQLAGVLIFCATYPIGTFLGARASLPALLFRINLPWLALSALAYFWAAGRGPLVAAKMNVVVYAGYAALAVFFFLRRSKWSASRQAS